MITVNLIPEQFLKLQRGRRRLRNGARAALLFIAVVCTVRIVVSGYVSSGYGVHEEPEALVQETEALRKLVDAKELANKRVKRASEHHRDLMARRTLAPFALGLARCAVPDNTTLVSMHVQQEEIVWIGVARDPREVSDMLGRITECCPALQPQMIHMRKVDTSGELFEDFEVRIAFSRESDQFRSCYKGDAA